MATLSRKFYAAQHFRCKLLLKSFTLNFAISPLAPFLRSPNKGGNFLHRSCEKLWNSRQFFFVFRHLAGLFQSHFSNITEINIKIYTHVAIFFLGQQNGINECYIVYSVILSLCKNMNRLSSSAFFLKNTLRRSVV